MAEAAAMKICGGMDTPAEARELAFAGEYTERERMMLEAIVSECGRCISSEGVDCMSIPGETVCPFVNVRQACGLHDLGVW